MNGKRTSLRLYARLRARKPNKCSKTAVKISSRSKLRLARTATHVVGRNWARSPKVPGKFTSGDNFIQRVMRREKFAIFNLWAVQEAPLLRCPFVYVRRYVATFFYPFDNASGFSSRATEKRASASSRKVRVRLYTFVLCLEFFKTPCSVVWDIAIKWSRTVMTPNEAATYKLYPGKIEPFDLQPSTSTIYFVDLIQNFNRNFVSHKEQNIRKNI